MPTPSDFIAPYASTGTQGLARAASIKRVIYALADDEDPTDFVAVDAGTGAQPWGLAFEGRLFWYDAADTTTAHDGITCLVTSDGKRYKVEGVAGPRYAVLDNEETDPPDTGSPGPSLGDAYIVPSAPTGDWSGHSDEIAVWTARGWRYIEPEIGLLVYVESQNGFWHYDENGDWVAGIGSSALAANSVTSNMLLGGRSHWAVVNQTTNAPPGSPSDGVAYIIGPSPTGDWSGHAAKIAQAINNTWIISTPQEGWVAYDQSGNAEYVYSGSAWESLAGAVVYEAITASTTWNKPAGLTASSRVFIEAWGAGGGGGQGNFNPGGGGGGGYKSRWMLASELTDSVTATIGAGGTVPGGQGGNSTFGSYLTAYGGGGGGTAADNAGGGGGAGWTSAGGNASGTTDGTGGTGFLTAYDIGGAGGNPGADSIYGGGGGAKGGSGSASRNGGRSKYGGGGGACGTSGTGGSSEFGGRGGTNGSRSPLAPGGGGYGDDSGATAGARGEIRVTVFR